MSPKQPAGRKPARQQPPLRGPATGKILSLTGLISAATLYWFLFLRLPVGAGIVDAEERPITRGGFLLSTMLLPESLIAAWFDGGRLASGFADRIPLMISTLLWLALATLVGLPLVNCVYTKPLSKPANKPARLEQFTLAALVGLAVLSTLTLLVGLTGGLHSPWPLAIGCAALALGAFIALLTNRSAATALQDSSSQHNASATSDGASRGLFDQGLMALTIGLTGWLAVVIMLGALVPSAEFDVMEYHLQAPKEFFQQGAIRFLPHNVYANMPLGAEMHSLAMMTFVGQNDAWLGGLVGKSILAATSLLTAALLGGYLARRVNAFAGWLAAGLWLASPGIAQTAMLGLIDGVLASYCVAAAIAVSYAIDASLASQSDGKLNKPRPAGWTVEQLRVCAWWGLAGLLAGAAAAIKYPGLLFAVLPVCVALAWTAHRPHQSARREVSSSADHAARTRLLLRAGGCVALGLAVTCGPWFAKNWALAENPVYPLAAGIFGGKTLTPEKIEQWQQAHRVPEAASETADFTQRVWATVRTAGSDLSRLVLTSPYVQPTVICGLMVATVLIARRRAVRERNSDRNWVPWLLWSLWILSIWWFATHRIDRFWLPLAGLWAGLGAFGLYWLRSHVSPWLAHAIVILGLSYSSVLNSSSLISDNRYFVALNALRDDTGDEVQVPRITREQAWINAHLSDPEKSTRVLLVGEARVFEYRVPIVYSTCFDINPGETLLKNQTPEAQLAALHEQGITHIMVNWSEIARYRSPGNYGFSDWPQPRDIQQLVDDQVATRVPWDIPDTAAVLLRVN